MVKLTRGNQVHVTMDNAKQEILRLSDALRLCQLELAQVRAEQEPLQETCCQAQVESRDARVIADRLAQALADQLSRDYWEERQPTSPIGWRRFLISRWSWLRKLLGDWRSQTSVTEDAQIRVLEASDLFRPDWYLQQNADVTRAGIHPAAHYLRTGASEGRDPGPEFNTQDYIACHPEIADGSINPLMHHLQQLQSSEQ